MNTPGGASSTYPAGSPTEGSDRPVRLLINALHARSGGGMTHLRNLLPRLAQDPGLDVHLCIHRDQESSIADIQGDIAVHALSFKQGFWRLLLREQVAVPRLARRIGAVVTFSLANYGPLAAPRPVILIANALAVGLLERRPRMMTYWALLALATLASVIFAREAIAVSDYARRSLTPGVLRPLRRRISVIPNGVDQLFSPSNDGARDDGLLLAVSDIYIQKNFESLILAFSKLVDGHAGLRLAIAGRPVDRQYYDRLTRLIADLGLQQSVQFLGHVPPDELVRLYRTCTVFVFPSLVETFGHPLVEAMACGAPIASSSTAAMPEVLGDAGLFFDPADARQMAATLGRLLNDAALRTELGERAVARACQYSWERTASETAAVIKRVAWTARRRPFEAG